MILLEAQEYRPVTLRGCNLRGTVSSPADYTHAWLTSLVEERARASRNLDEEWQTLGLHLEQGKPTAHWYVGQVWLDELKKVALHVTPKIKGLSIFRMYVDCLGDPEVCAHLDQTIQILWEHQPIPIKNKELRREITPLLIGRYLRLLSELCQRHLRIAFHKVEDNLSGKIRGRPLVAAQLRQNVARGRLDRIVCQFQILSMDTLANQILLATLEQSLKYLRRYSITEQTLWHWGSFSHAALTGVRLKRITPMDFKAVHYAGFLKPYQEPHRWARLLLQLLGYDPREALSVPSAPALPPFALNMNELFERYCEMLIRRKRDYKVWAGYGADNLGDTFKVRPDFLVANAQNGWIVDAKYKEEWSWDRSQYRSDVYQIMAYSRHEGVLQTLGDLVGGVAASHPTLVILYPPTAPAGHLDSEGLDLTQPTGRLQRSAGNDEFHVPLGRKSVALPVRKHRSV